VTAKRTPLDVGPVADVRVEPDGDRWKLIFVRSLRHPPERVWSALTDPAQQREWSPFVSDRDLGSVGEVVLTMVDGDSEQRLPSMVLRVEPPKMLEHTWDTDLLRWELVPEGVGTRLTLSHSLTERSWVPKVAAGWHLCLVVAEELLDGNPRGPVTGQQAREHGWIELRQEYGRILDIPITDC
jgi:uncharacterized protein YndB with AHSA1/START domain